MPAAGDCVKLEMASVALAWKWPGLVLKRLGVMHMAGSGAIVDSIAGDGAGVETTWTARTGTGAENVDNGIYNWCWCWRWV